MFEILVLIGTLMIVGFASRWVFERTRIPEVILLVCIGLMLGPLGLLSNITAITISPQDFRNAAPVVGAVAIISLVFDAGFRLKIEQVFRQISFSFFFSLANVFVCITVLVGILRLGFGWGLHDSLLLGSILGGTSSFAAYSLLPFVKASNHARGILYLEATISTIIVCILAITVMRYDPLDSYPAEGIKSIISSFSVSALLGLISGIVLLLILFKLHIRKFGYLLLLSSMFLLYFVDFVSFGGVGVISIITIGLVLGNSSFVFKHLGVSGTFDIEEHLKSFQEEITLFIYTFFIVYLGMIAIPERVLSFDTLLTSVALILGILASRSFVLYAGRRLGQSQQHEDLLLIFTMPRGLLSATLSALVFLYPYSQEFRVEVVTIVIVLSAVVTALGIGYYERKFKDTSLFKQEVSLKDGRKVTVRSFTRDDQGKIRKFLNELVKEGALISFDRYVNPIEEREMARESLEKINRGDMVVWVGEHDTRIIARALAKRGEKREQDNVSLSLYVAKEFRGLGLGTILLRMLISESKKVFRPRNLYLAAYSNNLPAISLYESEGFVKVGSLPGWSKYQNKYLDEIYMVYDPEQAKRLNKKK